MMTRQTFILCVLAVVYTLLNTLKPVVVDDGVYLEFAKQIAHSPTDPYGFDLFGQVPANHVLAPPVMPYWLAVAIRLSGEVPAVCKGWLLPFNLLLVFSTRALFRRFSPGWELPLTVLTVLSPALLPSLNLMLDVPAVALACFALTLFFRACDAASIHAALFAGLAAGLAMQTKYTAFTVPVVMLLYSGLFHRVRLGIIAAVTALLLFGAWELLTALQYGESHFLYAVQARQGPLWTKARLILPMIGILGGIAAPLAVLGQTALGRGRKQILAAGALVCCGFALLAVVPQRYETWFVDPVTGKGLLDLNSVVVGSFGILVVVTCCDVSRRLWLSRSGQSANRFLVLWLALELLSCFPLTPFPATRRLMSVTLVMALLVGRLLSQHVASGQLRRMAHGCVAFGVVLGTAFWLVDYHEACVERDAATVALRRVHQRQPGARIWRVGGWGFDYHARRAGMLRIPHGRFDPQPGDWLVMDARLEDQSAGIRQREFQFVEEILLTDSIPLKTSLCYYAGRTAIRHHEGPRFRVKLFRCAPDPEGPVETVSEIENVVTGSRR